MSGPETLAAKRDAWAKEASQFPPITGSCFGLISASAKARRMLVKGVRSGDLPTTKHALAGGADVTVAAFDVDGESVTAAHYAAYHGHTAIARFLVDCAGAAAEDAAAGGYAALLLACGAGDLAAAEAAVVSGASISTGMQSAAYAAAYHGHAAIAHFLVDSAGASAEDAAAGVAAKNKAQWRNDNPVASAQEDPAAERVEWDALKASIPKVPGGLRKAQELLGQACYIEDLPGVQRALASGADPDRRVLNAFGTSAGLDGEVLFGMGDGGRQDTAAIVAAFNGQARALRFVLVAGRADPNRDDGGFTRESSSGKRTPCYWACERQHHDCVRVLLALGARPDHSVGGGKHVLGRFNAVGTNKCTCPRDIVGE